MYGYCREKLLVNHFWELKGYQRYCMLLCVCSVIEHRWRQNQVLTFLSYISDLKLLFFVIVLLFFSKIVLVGVQDEGSRYASSAVSALKRLGASDPVLGNFRSSFAFAGYAGTRQPSWMSKQKIQQWKARYNGPSQITLKIPLSSSMSSQYSLLHLLRRYL